MNFLLEAPSVDTLAFGAQIVLIGMLTVFAVLGTIWACLTVFKIVFHDLPEKKKEKITIAERVEENTVETVDYAADDNEIIAVIAAAIAAAENDSPAGSKFRVVSFRRR